MNRRTVLAQMAVFGVISVVVVTYAVFGLLGVRLTDKPFTVTVHLHTGGGVFTGSEVAYRGVRVGEVRQVNLRASGVRLTLAIDHGTKIPSNAIAHVYDLSAVGEQYVDLVPTRSSSDYLHGGSVIPAARTTTPLKTATLLYDLGRFIDSIDARDLRVIGAEGAAAFAGTGPQLKTILTDSQTLLAQLTRSQDATTRLLRNGATLLRSAANHARDFDDFSASLRALTDTLASSTPTISRFLAEAAPTTRLVDALIRQNTPAAGVLLANLATLSEIQVARIPGLQTLLVAVPRFGELVPRIVEGDVLRGVLNFNVGQPLCSTGVPMTSPVSGTRTAVQDVTCSGAIPVRGAANAPRPGGDVQVTTYDAVGLVVPSGGPTVRLGTNGGQDAILGKNSWQALLLAVTGG